ncbi:MAG: UvrD-helicase domain-containing protein, partial [Tetrasphaera sp.]|nr:UvrD-helicase domain-containing protein [Tetrasphaera sp.]
MTTLFDESPEWAGAVTDAGIPTWAMTQEGPAKRHRDTEAGEREASGRHTDPEALLGGLNTQQREAVIHEGGPLLIVAGAGSGKTRVLAHRIAYLLGHRGVLPGQILAITFTNKAAGEMRERVHSLIGGVADGMWISTFHSACVRILRREAEHFGFTKNFTIYDSGD